MNTQVVSHMRFELQFEASLTRCAPLRFRISVLNFDSRPAGKFLTTICRCNKQQPSTLDSIPAAQLTNATHVCHITPVIRFSCHELGATHFAGWDSCHKWVAPAELTTKQMFSTQITLMVNLQGHTLQHIHIRTPQGFLVEGGSHSQREQSQLSGVHRGGMRGKT